MTPSQTSNLAVGTQSRSRIIVLTVAFVIVSFLPSLVAIARAPIDITFLLVYSGLLLTICTTQVILKTARNRSPANKRLFRFLQNLHFAIVLAGGLYILGVTARLNSLFEAGLKFGRDLAALAATVVSWAASGIVGNLAYHYVKRRFGLFIDTKDR